MKDKKLIWIVVGLLALLLIAGTSYKLLAMNYKDEEPDQMSGETLSEENDSVSTEELATQIGQTTDQAGENTENVTDENATDENTEEAEDNLDDSTVVKKDELSSEDNAIIKEETVTDGKQDSSIAEEKVTETPTKVPVATPVPTMVPETQPTTTPTAVPTATPTKVPTAAPTKVPTAVPTKVPTAEPTKEPTAVPQNMNTAANFTVYDKNGNAVSLSNYFGKPIVINFWASWCGPCKSEMPAFQKMYQSYGSDVVFLMVDMVDGYRETQSKGEAFVAENGYTFPVFFDLQQSASYAYSVTSYPTTYFIDRNGNVARSHKGAMSEATLKSEIQSLLK